jgi:hypothetical protein
MNCPKCKTENADGSDVCCKCNHVLVHHGTSKLAILSFFLGLASLLLMVFTAVPAIFVGLAARKRIRRSNGLIRGKRLVRWGIGLSCVGLFFLGLVGLWSIDAAPIENDYSVADLRSADAEFNESYEVLELLRDKELASEALLATPLEAVEDTAAEAEVVEVAEESVYGRGGSPDDEESFTYGDLLNLNYKTKVCEIESETFEEELVRYAEQIDVLWEEAANVREIIERLDGYEQIADLTSLSVNGQRHPFSSGFNMFRTPQLYTLHCCLEAVRGGESPETDLIVFDSVMRKCSVNARMFYTKLMCLGAMQSNISAANFIVNDPNVSDETVARISEHFVPVSDGQLSMENVIIATYLYHKRPIEERRFEEYDLEEFAFWSRTPFFKANSTIRLFRSYVDSKLVQIGSENARCREDISVWPRFYPASRSNEALIKSIANRSSFPKQYLIYNPVGWRFAQWYGGWMERIHQAPDNLQAQDDLFQSVLAARLGKE